MTAAGARLACVLEVDLATLARNVAAARAIAGGDRALVGVVKCDAYGCGTAAAARTLYASGIRQFGVGSVNDVLELVDHLPEDVRFLVMGWWGFEELRTAAAHRERIDLLVVAERQLDMLRTNSGYGVQIEVDSGLSRTGLPATQVESAIESLIKQGTVVSGVATHLRGSDSRTLESIGRFGEVWSRSAELFGPLIATLGGSSILRLSDRIPAQWGIRVGQLLYGTSLLPDSTAESVFRLKAEIVATRRIPAGSLVSYRGPRLASAVRVGVLPVGYAAGIPSKLGDRGWTVYVGGAPCPLLSVDMNWTLVDLGDAPFGVGACVEIIGSDTSRKNSLVRAAQKLDCLPHELSIHLGRFATRRHVS